MFSRPAEFPACLASISLASHSSLLLEPGEIPINGAFLLIRWVLGPSPFLKPHCYGVSSAVTTPFLAPYTQWTVGETEPWHPMPVTSDGWPQASDIMVECQLVEDLDTLSSPALIQDWGARKAGWQFPFFFFFFSPGIFSACTLLQERVFTLN